MQHLVNHAEFSVESYRHRGDQQQRKLKTKTHALKVNTPATGNKLYNGEDITNDKPTDIRRSTL